MAQRPSTFDIKAHQPVPLWRDIRVLQIVAQIVFVIIVVVVGAKLFNNMMTALADANLLPNFDFLARTAGFEISEGPEFDRSETFGRAFQVGVINTLRVVGAGLALATVLGVIMGIARLSSNWLVRNIALVYIEIMRNTPLLVQLFFLYLGVFLALPRLREAIQLPGPIFLSRRGLVLPAIIPTEAFPIWFLYIVVGFVVAGFFWYIRTKYQEQTGHPGRRMTYAVVSIIGFTLLGTAVVGGFPFEVGLPEISGLRVVGGTKLSPEYAALLTGLVLYTGAFIAEVVRAGIQAIPFGQIEAARALGLTYGQTLQLVVLPQALRIIIPPLGNQYLNLAKNSSLGIAVGYADLFQVSNTIANQSGQSVPVIAMVMATYLTISLTISAVMNWINGLVRIKER